MRRPCVTSLCLLAVLAPQLRGQAPAEPGPGARIRVSASSATVVSESAPPRTVAPIRNLVGRVRAADADSLLLDRAAARVHLQWDAVERLEISRGRSRGRGARSGALVGGLALGTHLGLTLWRLFPDPSALRRGFLAGATVGGLVGAGAGALIGVEVWQRVPAGPRPAGVGAR